MKKNKPFDWLKTLGDVAEGVANFSKGNVNVIIETSSDSGMTYITYKPTIQEERYICLYNDPKKGLVKTLLLDQLSKEVALEELKKLFEDFNRHYIAEEIFICVIKAIV